MEYYVLTEKPALRDIKNEKLSINFYVKKDWSEDDIVQKKTDAGYINVSSPELTALDLLNYGSFGINRIFTILQELSEVMKAPDLTRAARNYAQTTTDQRLGYLLAKETQNAMLAGALKRAIRDRKYLPIPLLKESTNDTGEDRTT